MKAKSFTAILCLAVLFSCCSSVFGDPLNNWHWRNPLPNNNTPPGAYGLYGVTFAKGNFYAVGRSGVVLVSPDGTNWNITSTATTSQLNDIIYANGEFVAAGNSGVVETSPDGENWTLQNSGTTQSLNSLAYGNGKFVAVGGSAVISSPDAVTWTLAVSGLSGADQVAGGSAGFVAINGSTNAYSSSDGLNWTYHPLLAPPGAGDIDFTAPPLAVNIVTFENGSFLIGGYQWMTTEGLDLCIYSSNDGNNWSLYTPESFFTTAFFLNFFLNGTTNIIVGGMDWGNGFVQISTNGLDWSQAYSAAGLGNAGTYGNGVYVVVVSSQTIYTSPDGINWTNLQHAPAPPVGPTGNCYSIASSNGTYVVATSSSFIASTNDLSYTVESNTPSLSSVILFSNNFVAVGASGAIYQSTNGFSWTLRNSGTANNLHAVTAGGLLVAVGDDGAVQTSPSGLIWTTRSSGTSLPLYGVAYSNGLYVAVGQEGTVVTSPDGANWTVQYSGDLSNLLSVTYGSAGFLAVGQGGTILTSPDGVNWTQQNSGTTSTLESASFGNGYYLVTGANALAMTSPDGSTWTERNVGATSGQTLSGSAFLNGCFDIVGSGGTVLESDPVSPLFALQMSGHPPQCSFELFATPGMSYRVLACTNLANPSWSTAATVNNAAAITQWTNSPTAGNQCYFRLVSP